LIISLIFSSLKTVPSILLERHLAFSKLVIPQIAENVVFYATAVILAYYKFQIASFTWAVLLRGVTGLVLIYVLSPWKPGLGIDKESAKKLTSFGVPFQVNSILALFKDDMLTVFLGKILTFTQIGYIGWAQKWAFIPLRFFMDNVNKVTFPAYSRLQDHKAELAKAVEKSIFFVTFLVYPSVFGMIAIAPQVVSLVPNYGKWEPALPLLYLFAINALFSAVSTTFTNTLFAIGRPKIVLKFMAFWTAATWLLTVPLVLKFGYIGVAMASAIVAATSLATVYFVKKEFPITIAKNIFGPLFISLIMFFLVKAILITFPKSVLGMLLAIVLGAGIYFVLSLAIFKRHLVEDATIIVKSIILKG